MPGIFAGKRVPVPKEADVLYATISAMAAHARAHAGDRTSIANALAYAVQMPPDFAAVLFRDFCTISPELKQSMMTTPEFNTWLSKNGRFFNR